MEDGAEKDDKKADESRRNFLKASVVASAALAVGGMAAIAKVADETGGDETTSTGSSQVTFPDFPIVGTLVSNPSQTVTANVNTLQVDTPINFFYPLDNEPNILMKLGVPAEGGVGPDGDIVAFSDICQHLGCNPGFVYPGGPPPFCNSTYSTKSPVMYCCCHGSIYDVTNAAKVIGGPAPYPVPQVMLTIDDDGNIHAVGMGPPTIYQHGTPGSTDVSADLVGGTLVTSATNSESS